MLINHAALMAATHGLYALEYNSECDELGIDLVKEAGTRQIEDMMDRLLDELLMPVAYRLVGQIEGAWGTDLGLFMVHALPLNRTEEEEEHFLSDLFLGVNGHGVTVWDDFSEEIVRAEDILRISVPRRGLSCDWSGEALREMALSEIAKRFPDAVRTEDAQIGCGV